MDGHRCDLSFTLFPENFSNYDSNELMLEQEHGLLKVKPAIGSIFVDSTGLMLRVTPVTRRGRLACEGWIKSRIRDGSRRAISRDLNIAHRAFAERRDEDQIVDLLLKSSGNPMRMWRR